MAPLPFSDQEAAEALTNVIGASRWMAVSLSKAFLELKQGIPEEKVARGLYERGTSTLKASRETIGTLRSSGFLSLLIRRERTGSAENPITKLFPGAITEQRFLELLDDLHAKRPSVTYRDERGSGHTLVDFFVDEGELHLPVNVKNAGTRFERAQQLVALEPNDCIPIPAYKAYQAIEDEANLVYVVCPDYDLVGNLQKTLPKLFDRGETVVWDLLNQFQGSHYKDAEDAFITLIVRKHWVSLKPLARNNPFQVISARKAIRILQRMPKRTPGIGLKAWGTGAAAEVNVHISICGEMTPWETVSSRIEKKGIMDIVDAVNRKKVEEVYDPEI